MMCAAERIDVLIVFSLFEKRCLVAGACAVCPSVPELVIVSYSVRTWYSSVSMIMSSVVMIIRMFITVVRRVSTTGVILFGA